MIFRWSVFVLTFSFYGMLRSTSLEPILPQRQCKQILEQIDDSSYDTSNTQRHYILRHSIKIISSAPNQMQNDSDIINTKYDRVID